MRRRGGYRKSRMRCPGLFECFFPRLAAKDEGDAPEIVAVSRTARVIADSVQPSPGATEVAGRGSPLLAPTMKASALRQRKKAGGPRPGKIPPAPPRASSAVDAPTLDEAPEHADNARTGAGDSGGKELAAGTSEAASDAAVTPDSNSVAESIGVVDPAFDTGLDESRTADSEAAATYTDGTDTCTTGLGALETGTDLDTETYISTAEDADTLSLASRTSDDGTTLTTMTLSDMPHCAISDRLAEKARLSILYDRDDAQGRLGRGVDQRIGLSEQSTSVCDVRSRCGEPSPRMDFQLGDHLDPNEIYFLSDGIGKLQQLGKGAFGTVYKGIWQGATVAVKVCRERKYSERSLAVFHKESSILRSCCHPHIVQLKGACTWKAGKRTVLVTEYMDGGDLCNALGRWPELFSWEYGIGRRVAYEVAKGLAFLHANNIVHFDLKSGNVLLDRWNTAKIADVGLAKRLVNYHGEAQLSTFCRTEEFGTYAWAAPEVIVGAPCTTAADIFSFGVLLFEILTTELPESRRLRPIRVPHEGPQEAADLVRACCLTNPAARPTAEALVDILALMQ